MVDEESYVVSKDQCPKCAAQGNDNSGDNLAIYSDGHHYCYACKYYKNGTKETMIDSTPRTKEWTPVTGGSAQSIPERKITEEACRKFGYRVVSKDGQDYQIAPYYRDGELVGQHIRGANKAFKWLGSPRGAELFGQNKWEKGGKRLVITEGELDALSVFQVNNGWPVVSLSNGVQSAVRAIKENLEFVSSYKEVILMFDMDDAGQTAAKEVSALLPPGKAKIASLPYKDANECLMKNHSKAIVSAIFQAAPYSPDEILHVSSINTEDHHSTQVWPLPWDSLTEFLIGQRSGEISLWASGTGSGKSTILREVAMAHLNDGRSVGMIMLEESPQETMDDMISLMINKPVRALRAGKMMNELREKMGKDPIIAQISDLTDDEYTTAKTELGATKLYIYDHLGNSAMQNIMARIEYMAVSLGVNVVILDHITALAAGLATSEEGGNNERLLIDSVMKDLRALAVRTGVRIDIVSQLKKNEKHYEEGSRITLQDLRGSGSLASVPNVVIGLERDRQADCEKEANTTVVRVLKNRLTGRAGMASALFYDREKGRLRDVPFATNENGDMVTAPDNPFGNTT
tara:strand:+ start:7107 stop:8831 length:1725 start_codon:yes stop_codon:yes gene_type:complete